MIAPAGLSTSDGNNADSNIVELLYNRQTCCGQEPRISDCVIDISQDGTESERVTALELGYRHRFKAPVSIDISLFNNEYDQSKTNRDDSHGLEFVGNYLVSPNWTTELSYTYHKGRDIDSSTGEQVDNGMIPENSVNLRSMYTINEQWQFDTFIFYVDELEAIAIPSYTRLDLRLGWVPSKHIETSLLLSNVAQDANGEAVEANRINTGMPTSAYLQFKYLH